MRRIISIQSQVCSSFDCKDFNVCGPERMLPSQQFKLRVDVRKIYFYCTQVGSLATLVTN